MRPGAARARRAVRPSSGPGDRGSGTVLAVGLVGVLSTLLVAGLLVATVAVQGQRVRTAADLAALAAAGRVLEGGAEEEACRSARVVAQRNGAHLAGCALDADGAATAAGLPLPSVEVVVVRGVADTGWQVSARARAGGVPPGRSP